MAAAADGANRYGLAGDKHRHPINNVVTKTPITPNMDMGASAAKDCKLHSGSKVVIEMNRMDACRDANHPVIPSDAAKHEKVSPMTML